MQPEQKADNLKVAKRGTYVYQFAVVIFVFHCVGILIFLVWCTVLIFFSIFQLFEKQFQELSGFLKEISA